MTTLIRTTYQGWHASISHGPSDSWLCSPHSATDSAWARASLMTSRLVLSGRLMSYVSVLSQIAVITACNAANLPEDQAPHAAVWAASVMSAQTAASVMEGFTWLGWLIVGDQTRAIYNFFI